MLDKGRFKPDLLVIYGVVVFLLLLPIVSNRQLFYTWFFAGVLGIFTLLYLTEHYENISFIPKPFGQLQKLEVNQTLLAVMREAAEKDMRFIHQGEDYINMPFDQVHQYILLDQPMAKAMLMLNEFKFVDPYTFYRIINLTSILYYEFALMLQDKAYASHMKTGILDIRRGLLNQLQSFDVKSTKPLQSARFKDVRRMMLSATQQLCAVLSKKHDDVDFLPPRAANVATDQHDLYV